MKALIKNLPNETKKMHESQKIWRRRNWQKTLKEHKDSIEKIISIINLFDIWSNKLQVFPAAKMLIREIFMDSYISIHFANYGLYKYAHMCLRSELETTLRLVFFSTHPVEYQQWLQDKHLYRTEYNYPDVWGRGYIYFRHLSEIELFESKCDETKRLFASRKVGIGKLYSELSKFIHSGAQHFQTRSDRVSPRYDVNEFNKWCKTHETAQIYIHVILALGFPKEFKGMTSTKSDKILNIGISTYYRDKVKESLGL